jgi:DNA-binding transcriptional regulator PaaX
MPTRRSIEARMAAHAQLHDPKWRAAIWMISFATEEARSARHLEWRQTRFESLASSVRQRPPNNSLNPFTADAGSISGARVGERPRRIFGRQWISA